jgi:hypothetical protein
LRSAECQHGALFLTSRRNPVRAFMTGQEIVVPLRVDDSRTHSKQFSLLPTNPISFSIQRAIGEIERGVVGRGSENKAWRRDASARQQHRGSSSEDDIVVLAPTMICSRKLLDAEEPRGFLYWTMMMMNKRIGAVTTIEICAARLPDSTEIADRSA